jgi:hypothetical protein
MTIGATEGLLIDSIPGIIKLICNGRFVCSFKDTELGIFTDAGFDAGLKFAFLSTRQGTLPPRYVAPSKLDDMIAV